MTAPMKKFNFGDSFAMIQSMSKADAVNVIRGTADADLLDLMPDAAAAARRSGSRLAYLLSASVVVFLAIFIAWANLAVLDEVTRGDGQVIPSSRIQVIQNLEGGILAEAL